VRWGSKKKPAELSSIQRRLPGWLSSLEGPRKLAINGLVVIVSMLGSGVVLKDALKQVAVIDTISVPKDLEADGYTPATMGQRIIDAVTQVNRNAAMTRRIGTYTLSEVDPLEPESADYESPGRAHSSDSASAFTLTSDDPSKKYDVSVSGVSLTTVILHLRELFGVSDTRISGEVTVEHPPAVGLSGKDEKSPAKKLSIRLRISDKGHVQYEAEATDKLETLVEQAALRLVERFEPLDAAYYSYHKRDYDNALRIVRAYLADQTKKERQWASNLLGLIEHARYGHDEARVETGYDNAIAAFRKLRTSDPKFAPALYNLSFVLIDKGKKQLKEDPNSEKGRELFTEAYEVAREGIAIDEAADRTGRKRAVGYATAGRALRFLGQWEPAKYDEALSYFDRSTGVDPTFMYAYFSQGAIHNERNAPDDAIAKYQLATEINPSAQIFTRAGASCASTNGTATLYQCSKRRRTSSRRPMPTPTGGWPSVARHGPKKRERSSKEPSKPIPPARTPTISSASCISTSKNGMKRPTTSHGQSKRHRNGLTITTTSVVRSAAPVNSGTPSRPSRRRTTSTGATPSPKRSWTPRAWSWIFNKREQWSGKRPGTSRRIEEGYRDRADNGIVLGTVGQAYGFCGCIRSVAWKYFLA
jgi:hypothetical protein